MDNHKKTIPSGKGLLITPSASPVPSRPFPSRLSDGRSPTKRSRLTATPSGPSEPITTPPAISFAAQTYHTDTGDDLHKARQASSTRILGIWSQLAERYSRPLAEDDIVDLRKKDIVKDRNVLRFAPCDYEMGCFADVYSGGADTPTDEGEWEGDSDDELDAFAPGADISDELERANREKVTAIKEMDPADAEDLREFLEAESRWREEFGGEDDEGDDDELEEGGDLDEDEGVDNEGDDDEPEERGDLDEDEGVDDMSASDVRVAEFQYEPDEQEDVSFGKDDQGHLKHDDDKGESSSDDELAIWDEHDEGSAVYAIAGDSNSINNDDAIETPLPHSANTPLVSSSPPPRKRSNRPRPTPRPQTPSLRFRSPSPLNMSPPVLQLHTPPQSSSSATGTTPDTFARSPLPSISSPSRTKSKLTTAVKSMPESDTNSLSKETAKAKHKTKFKAQETLLANHTNSKWVAEVVIPRNASSNSTPKTRTPSRSTSHSRPEVIELLDDDDSIIHRRQTPAKNKSKSKAKEDSNSDLGWSMTAARDTESDDPITLPSPDVPERSSARQLSVSDSERFYTPLPSTPRKRKRVVSALASMESERSGNEDDSGPSLHLISPEIDLIDFSKHRPYHQGQASPLPISNFRRKRDDATRRSSTYLKDDSGTLFNLILLLNCD